jgi:hypothetical protein
MSLYTGFYSTNPTQKDKHAMVKCKISMEIGRRSAGISSIFYGKAGIHKIFHPGKQSIITRNSLKYFGIHESCAIYVRKNKYGGWVVGGVWWLVSSFMYETYTHCNSICIFNTSYDEYKSIWTVLSLLNPVSCTFTKALQDIPCCMSPSHTRFGAILHLYYHEIKGAKGGDALAAFMTSKGNLMLSNGTEMLLLVSQLSALWHVCIMLRNIEQREEGEKALQKALPSYT